jgi:uncharacterized protein YktB (UPF0637 family)
MNNMHIKTVGTLPKRFLINIYTILIFIFISCINNNKNIQNNIFELDKNKKGTIRIDDSDNNSYLGYISLKDNDKDSSNELWISGVYVYEKYVINQMFYGFHSVGVAIYNRNRNLRYNEYENQKELFKTYEHYVLGIYDNYLFLIIIGNAPTYQEFIIIDLKNDEIIYKGEYIFNIGIKFIEPYIIEIYECNNKTINEKKYNTIYYQYMFDQYLFNLKTKEKINLNRNED